MKTLTGFVVLALAAVMAAPASAQRTAARFAADSATRASARPALRAVRIAKWSTLVAGASGAAYGFTTNRKADTNYRSIEAICKAAPVRCIAHNADGSYRDAALESMYQDVRALDRRSRIALIGGQASLAASVVLFILDLREAHAPANVPYNPRKQSIVAGAHGLELRLALP